MSPRGSGDGDLTPLTTGDQHLKETKLAHAPERVRWTKLAEIGLASMTEETVVSAGNEGRKARRKAG